MQPLTDPVLRPYTSEQITGLLTGPSVAITSGLELLDDTDTLIADISDDLAGGQIARNMTATIHGTASLQVSQPLVWGAQRVRPHMTLTDPGSGLSARWNLGVYVMATPDLVVAEDPQTFQVTGSDKLYLLDGPIGDAYSVAAGVNVLQAVKSAIQAGCGDTNVQLDGSAQASTLPHAMVWSPSSSQQYTWLDVCNALLKTVGYEPLWCDWNGAYRSRLWVDPAVRSPEFAFTADDVLTTIVGAQRTLTRDLWQAPNWWRLIAQNWPSTPVEGNGQVTMANPAAGPSSQQAVGRTVRKVLYVNAADQAGLIAQANKQVAADLQVVASLAVTVSPFPPAWHEDVYTYTDAAAGGVMQVTNTGWTLDLAGADGAQSWQVCWALTSSPFILGQGILGTNQLE